MRALRLLSWKSEPVLVDVPDPLPGPGEVVVRIGGAGACHSDLHLMHDMGSGPSAWAPPFTLGHENAGWVHELGDGVVGLSIGQAVAVYGPWGCGACERCRLGFETYCENPSAAPVTRGGGGLGLDGGMAEYLLVPAARHLLPLPEGLEPAEAAPLTDAALTPYHAIRRSLPKLTPGSTVVVIGVGGLGHLGVQLLAAMTACRIVAVDSRAAALELALAAGAHVAVEPGGALAAVRAQTGGRGADVVLDFVGAQPTVELAVACARTLGDLTVVGIGGGRLPVGFGAVPHEVSIQTTYWGSRPELAEVLALAGRGLVRPEVTTFPLGDAAHAYELLAAGQIAGRAVIVP